MFRQLKNIMLKGIMFFVLYTSGNGYKCGG